MKRHQLIRFNLFITTLLCFACVSLTSVHAAEWYIKHKSSHNINEDIVSGYCLASVDFDGNRQIVIARDYSGSASLAYRHSRNISPADITTFKIDNLIERRLSTKVVNTDTLIASLMYDYDFLNALKAGSTLEISHGNQSMSVPLSGSAYAIKNIDNCLKTNSGMHNAGAQSPVNTGAIPVPGSIMSQTFHKNPVYRKDFYNDPARTYIKVHFPGQKMQPPVSAMPVEPVERIELGTGKSMCTSAEPKAADYLSQKIASSLGPKVVKFIQEKQPDLNTPIFWEQDNVKANLITTGLQQHDLMENVFADLEKTCVGDFARQHIVEDYWQGIRLDHYKVACYHQDQKTHIDLNFITDGFETAILSFEAAPVNLENLSKHRAYILSEL